VSRPEVIDAEIVSSGPVEAELVHCALCRRTPNLRSIVIGDHTVWLCETCYRFADNMKHHVSGLIRDAIFRKLGLLSQ